MPTARNENPIPYTVTMVYRSSKESNGRFKNRCTVYMESNVMVPKLKDIAYRLRDLKRNQTNFRCRFERLKDVPRSHPRRGTTMIVDEEVAQQRCAIVVL